jgi:predicted alpha/beta superfamily hydrolase
MQDITFRSAVLNRDMHYRVVLPASIATRTKLPVVYLLHGGAAIFATDPTIRTWRGLLSEG